MSELEQRLLARLGSVIAALSESDETPLLIGGLAVHVQLQTQLAGELGDEDEWLEPHPAALARRGRVTMDIDLGVRSASSARHTLRSLGFDGSSEFSVSDGHVTVDFIPYASESGDHRHASRALSLFPDAVDTTEVLGASRRVASRAFLVILKSIAWCDRQDPKDLADIARLALADWRSRATASELRVLVQALPADLRGDVERVRALFEGTDSGGARAFLEACLGVREVYIDDHSGTRHEDVRRTINQAVERLFAFVED